MGFEVIEGAVQIIDASGNGPVAVKPPSTPVTVADSALTVGLHPSSPLPEGTNTIGAVSLNSGVSGGTIPDTFQYAVEMLSELRQIRKLLEILTDESVQDEE